MKKACQFSSVLFFLFTVFSAGVFSAEMNFVSPAEKDFWALQNFGLPQKLSLSGSIPYYLKSVPGEDLHLPKKRVFQEKMKSVIVAVLDSGLDVQHPWISKSLAKKGQDCGAKLDQDLDGNDYPGDCYGWNLVRAILQKNGVYGDGNIKDPHGHGTHIASLVTMIAEKVFGSEENPIRILPVRVLNEKSQGVLIPNSMMDADLEQLLSPKENAEKGMITSLGDSIARALIYAYRQGAGVINISLSWPPTRDSSFLHKVVQYLSSKGVLIIASSGNDESSRLPGPCSYPEVLCVGSVGSDGALSFFSNFGAVDVAAPGLQILGAYPLDLRNTVYRKSSGFEILDGSSQATPMVTALAATLISLGEKPENVFPRIKLSSRPLSVNSIVLNSNFNPVRNFSTEKIQWGMVDFDQAIHSWSKEQQNKVKNVWEPAQKETLNIKIQDATGRASVEVPFVSWGFLSKPPEQIRISSFQADFHVLQYDWKFQSGNRWILKLEIEITGKKEVSSESWMLFHLVNQNFEKDYRIPVDLTRPLSVEKDSFTKEIPFQHSLSEQDLKNSLYLSVLWSLQPMNQPEYIVTRFDAKGIQLGLISPSKNPSKLQDISYEYKKFPFLPFQDLGEMSGPRLNIRTKSRDQGKDFYLFGIVADIRQQKSSQQQAYFIEMDEDGKVESEKKWFSDQAFLNDDLHWIEIQGRSRPLWIALANGQRAHGRKASWLETQEQSEDFRRHLFFLDKNWNLQMIEDIPGYEFVQLFSMDHSSTKYVLARVYPFAQASFQASYAWFQYQDGKVLPKPLLAFLAPANLMQQNFVVHSNQEVIYFQSEMGRILLTGLRLPFAKDFFQNSSDPSQDLFPSPVWQKSFHHPDEPRHGLKWLSAALGEKNRRQFLFLSHSEVVGLSMGKDFQKYSFVNLDRFSMLPSQSMLSVMFPFFVSDSRTGEKKLSMYVPQRQSVFPGLRVLSFQGSGSSQKLEVPWKFHWQVEEPCLPLSDGAILSGHLQKFVFDSICGNTLRRSVFEESFP